MRTDLIRATVLTAAGIAATAGGIAGPAIAAHAAPTTKATTQAQTDRHGERELNVHYQAQPNFYYCGPAATRNALSVQGKTIDVDAMAKEMGTTEAGTNSVNDITPVLNKETGSNVYHSVEIKDAKADDTQTDKLRTDIIHTVDNGRAVVANIAGTTTDTDGNTHSFEGGHYISVVGYHDNGHTVTIADSANPNMASYRSPSTTSPTGSPPAATPPPDPTNTNQRKGRPPPGGRPFVMSGYASGQRSLPARTGSASSAASVVSSRWARRRSHQVLPSPARTASDQARPGDVLEPVLGRPAHAEEQVGGAEGPDQAAGRVRQQEPAVRHVQRARQRAGEDPQQRHEATEEDRPDTVPGEALLGAGQLCGAEVFGEAPAQPGQQGRPPRRPTAYPTESPTMAPAAAAVATHSRLDDAGGGEQSGADQHDLAGQRDTHALHADHRGDDQVDHARRQRGEPVLYVDHRHPFRSDLEPYLRCDGTAARSPGHHPSGPADAPSPRTTSSSAVPHGRTRRAGTGAKPWMKASTGGGRAGAAGQAASGARNSSRLPCGSWVWKRRMPGISSSPQVTGWPAAASRAASSSRSGRSSAGWALRAGRKSASTPRCSSASYPVNQQPPRAARAGGLGFSVRPSRPV